ncbi:MAG: response regulator [Eggerthellaceae bacterium]|jgi:DNA-binding NarL/FixJ family response regulator
MKVIVVDDDAVVASSLAIVLGAQSDIEVVGTGCSGEEAVTLFEDTAPDIALMDIQMPGTDGLDAAERILHAHPDARIVFLTTFADDEYIVRALRIGARGYLIKQDVAAIAPALHSVMRGQRVLEGEVLDRAVSLQDAPAAEPNLEALFPQLTEREREVVALVAQGLDNREIANKACMSEGTVRNHISDILAKLQLSNRTQIAVAYYRAMQHG